MGSTLTISILSVFSFKLSIYKNDYAEHGLETLCKLDFDLIYSLITILLRSNNLGSKENCQIALAFLTHKENWSHFLEDNCFCQIIYKYTLIIASQEIKMLVAYKTLRLSISKVNIKILGKFNAILIAQY